jgi:hypothetical protein
MVDLYLSKHDPNERAKRQLIRGKLNAPSAKENSIGTKTNGPNEPAGETAFAEDKSSANSVKTSSTSKPKGASLSVQKMSNLQFLRTILFG